MRLTNLTTIAATLAVLVPFAMSAEAAPGRRGEDRASVRHVEVATYAPLIERRIFNQNRRIRIGRFDGSIDRWEARRLRAGLGTIRWQLREARYDGRITRHERRRLHQMLDRNSRRIEAASFDRPSWRRDGGRRGNGPLISLGR